MLTPPCSALLVLVVVNGSVPLETMFLVRSVTAFHTERACRLEAGFSLPLFFVFVFGLSGRLIRILTLLPLQELSHL